VVDYLFEVQAINQHNLLVTAIKQGHFNIVKYLIEPTEDSLLASIVEGQLDIVKYLVDVQKVDPTMITDMSFYNVLFYAVISKDADLDIVKYLIEEQKVNPSSTTLLLAKDSGNEHIVEYFVNGLGINDEY
jgi:hypothetical protein